MSEYDLGLRFDKKPRKKRPTPERQDKTLILKTWPRLFMQYGPHTKGYKNS